jgi:hypothetical protein
MACVRKRRVGKGFRWVLDYRDQQGRRSLGDHQGQPQGGRAGEADLQVPASSRCARKASTSARRMSRTFQP